MMSPGGAYEDEEDVLETMYILKVRGTIMPEPLRELLHVVHFMQNRQLLLERRESEVDVGNHSGHVSLMSPVESKWKATAVTRESTGAFNLAPSSSSSSHTIKEVRWHGERGVYSIVSDKEPPRSVNQKGHN